VAAEQNNTDAMFSLGFMHYHGNGVDKSYAMAREWWAKGAEQGNKDCMRDLKKMDEEETTLKSKEKN
jgi:TPR repeat protein